MEIVAEFLGAAAIQIFETPIIIFLLKWGCLRPPYSCIYGFKDVHRE